MDRANQKQKCFKLQHETNVLLYRFFTSSNLYDVYRIAGYHTIFIRIRTEAVRLAHLIIHCEVLIKNQDISRHKWPSL